MIKKNDENNWPVWATESIEIASPDPNWLSKGLQEKRMLNELLSPLGIHEIEHYGSTSIPQLPSKPIIDLMAKVYTFNKIDDIALLLADFDWHYVPPHLDNRPWQRFFVKVKNEKRVAHLHFLLDEEVRWDKQLLFRDILRNNKQLTMEYAHLKTTLAIEFRNSREEYTSAKTDFINRVLKFK
ncbi:GrpB family protein [Niallia sp. 01092]|uniref:GrpB family protein n=1 Tax=unclassified Niallia TaxID=2837522 RepID=UPI003FD0B981